jgi:hypothetical protein
LCASAGRTASQKPDGYDNQWHWPRDTQLGEDAHHYAQRNGVQVLALLRTLALNLLRCIGFGSIRAGRMAVAHDISRRLGWVGISASSKDDATFSQPWVELIRQSSESLASRICYLELSGLSVLELGAAASERLWIRGGFPVSVQAPDGATAAAGANSSFAPVWNATSPSWVHPFRPRPCAASGPCWPTTKEAY